jgi:hypothetical protein
MTSFCVVSLEAPYRFLLEQSKELFGCSVNQLLAVSVRQLNAVTPPPYSLPLPRHLQLQAIYSEVVDFPFDSGQSPPCVEGADPVTNHIILLNLNWLFLKRKYKKMDIMNKTLIMVTHQPCSLPLGIG